MRRIEVLREADNAAKREPLEALEAEVCSAKPICNMKNVCARGYRQHVEAYAELQRAAKQLDSTEPSDLAAIEARLARAQSDVKACANAEATTRRSHDL